MSVGSAGDCDCRVSIPMVGDAKGVFDWVGISKAGGKKRILPPLTEVTGHT